MMKKYLPLFLVLLLPTPSFAFFVSEGETGASFLRVPLGARAASLGSAFTSISGDATALEYNPAGLGGLTRSDTNITHQEFLEDSSFQSITLGYPIRLDRIKGKRRTPQTTPTRFITGLQFRQFNAEDNVRDADGVKLTEFDIRDQLLQLSMAYAVSSRIYLGVSGKIIRQKIQNESLSNSAFDAGLILKLMNHLSVGASILNVGPDKGFVSEDDPLPTTARVGASFDTNRFLLTTDVSIDREKQTTEALGTEWKLGPIVRVRAGTLFHTTLEFTGGLGVKLIRTKNQQNVRDDNSRRQRQTNGKLLDEEELLSRKKKLRNTAKRQKSQGPNFDLGLNYAIRTNDELGVSHSITLKFEY